MKKLFLFSLILIGASSSQAQQLVPQGSEIRFLVKQMGVPVEGVFRKFAAQLKFNPKDTV